MSTHTVTILTSVYNNDDFLEGFLADIEKQTVFKDCCLCLVNCGNSESDDRLCRDFLKKYPNNVRLFIPDRDPGIYGAWNIGITATDSPYITNANVDDRLCPTAIKDKVAFLYANPDIDLVYSKGILSNKPNQTFEQIVSRGRYNLHFTGEYSKQAIKRSCLPHNAPLWRRRLHDKNGLFDSSMRSAGDYEFWLRCVANGAEFKRLNKTLNVYYNNPNGLSTAKANHSWRHKEYLEVMRRYQKI